MGWQYDVKSKLWNCYSAKKKDKIVEKNNNIDKI